jgi:hypothetical protein
MERPLMRRIPPEAIGIPREVLFRIPVAGQKDWLLILCKKNADQINALAQADGITAKECLVELIKRELGTSSALPHALRLKSCAPMRPAPQDQWRACANAPFSLPEDSISALRSCPLA